MHGMQQACLELRGGALLAGISVVSCRFRRVFVVVVVVVVVVPCCMGDGLGSGLRESLL